jgi:MFS family permease
MLSPVALAIVVNAMPEPRERAQAIGVWASVFGLSMAASPVAGGALIAAFGWRSVFWINAPVIVAAVILSAVLVPESRADRPRRLDLPGQALLTATVCVCVATLIEGPRIGWESPAAWAGYLLTAAAAATFVTVELRRREPLIDLGLFRSPSFSTAVLGAVVLFAALSLTLLLNTLYLQHTRGWTPLTAGIATLPMAFGAIVCAPLSGNLVDRHGPRRPLLLAGTFITAGGVSLVNLEHLDSTPSGIGHRHRHSRRAGRRDLARQSRPGYPSRMADRHRLRHLPARRGISLTAGGVQVLFPGRCAPMARYGALALCGTPM